MAFTLPDLPYPYDALEPYIDGRTMEIHHDKHHAAYVAKLNAALDEAPMLRDRTIEELLADPVALPESVRTAITNNGGGHYNHSLFWRVLTRPNGGGPSEALLRALDADFGSFEAFKGAFGKAALNQFGSGWAWLCAGLGRTLSVVAMPNQDTPLSRGLTPIFGVDVWEHAYYLKYQNRRADYVAAFWNVVDWRAVEANFEAVPDATRG